MKQFYRWLDAMIATTVGMSAPRARGLICVEDRPVFCRTHFVEQSAPRERGLRRIEDGFPIGAQLGRNERPEGEGIKTILALLIAVSPV